MGTVVKVKVNMSSWDGETLWEKDFLTRQEHNLGTSTSVNVQNLVRVCTRVLLGVKGWNFSNCHSDHCAAWAVFSHFVQQRSPHPRFKSVRLSRHINLLESANWPLINCIKTFGEHSCTRNDKAPRWHACQGHFECPPRDYLAFCLTSTQQIPKWRTY